MRPSVLAEDAPLKLFAGVFCGALDAGTNSVTYQVKPHLPTLLQPLHP